MARNKVWRDGCCPVCDRAGRKVGEHHCHMQNLVLEGLRDGLTTITGDAELAKMVIHYSQTWANDPGMVALRRFEPLHICETCNEIDLADPPSRPGRCFSLSPTEMREIREAAGHVENFGSDFLFALRAVRTRETEHFRYRASLAPDVGRGIAVRLMAEGRIEATRKKLAELGERAKGGLRPSGITVAA